jgi:site-specific recombinase XerD
MNILREAERKIKDPVTVKNALGHSSITATMIYVHIVGSNLEKALSGENGD